MTESSERRIPLTCAWDAEPWLEALDGHTRLAWVCVRQYVAMTGFRGRTRRSSARTLARQFGQPAGVITKVLDAALAAGALVDDGRYWTILDWPLSDSTERVRKHRSKGAISDSVTLRNVTEKARSKRTKRNVTMADVTLPPIPTTNSYIENITSRDGCNVTDERNVTRFVQPSVDEVAAYMTERGWPNPDASAERFIAHYDAVGWVVGRLRTPMRDWRGAVRTWEQNERRRNRGGDDAVLAAGRSLGADL